ncbi:hypothetical protein D7X94_08460 [Acutalibacter sp. 1XD8-33]|nr:hypothetical protein D7X94_08460 [Acutalibacter sp. 1XD8-33]
MKLDSKAACWEIDICRFFCSKTVFLYFLPGYFLHSGGFSCIVKYITRMQAEISGKEADR